MRKLGEESVQKRTLSTMWLVFHPKAGLICTEPYKENAQSRANQLLDKCGGIAFIIEAASIFMTDGVNPKQVYKIEKNRLHIEQEMLG